MSENWKTFPEQCPKCKGYDTKYVISYFKNVSAVYCYKCDDINMKY